MEEKVRMEQSILVDNQMLRLEKPFLIRLFQLAIGHLVLELHLELVLQLLGGKGERACNRGWQFLSKLNYLNIPEEVFFFHWR